MNKSKKVLTSLRVIILLVLLLLAIVAIYPTPFAKGVAIRTVAKDSAASLAGIESPKPTVRPVARERIIAINNVPINTVADYYDFTSSLDANRTLQVKTNKKIYRLTTKPLTETIYLNETELKKIEETFPVNKTINGTTVLVNETVTKTIEVQKTETNIIGVEDIGLDVYDAPKNNIKKGLDLQGGTRVLLKPEKQLTSDEMEMLINNMKQRLNVYGLTDIIVREAGDLVGNQYILVEIAGATKGEVKELLSKQGKFEADIGKDVVFKGGSDITYVCRSANCAGIDPTQGCGQTSATEWNCRFRFAISLSPEAAQRQADLTQNLGILPSQDGKEYLDEKLILYLDDEKVDELNIGVDLKGRAVTEIEISGTGAGRTQQAAVFDALQNMKRLQTILITGSLPVKLSIEKTDEISSFLGDEFVKNSLEMGLLAVIAVSLVIFLRFKKIKIATFVLLTMLAEVILLFGIAALIGWNIDLAAIAGIIVAVGTGVDDQIVITDEVLRRETQAYNWKERFKRAFFIIFAAYFATVVAMIPLFFAGAGLFKGFALTTILGVTIGILFTRPAYAAIIEVLLKE